MEFLQPEDWEEALEARAAHPVALPLREKVRVLRVLALPTRRGPAPEARACYEELGIDEGGPRS